MIKEITESETPDVLKPHLEGWQEYLTTAIELAPFTGINWQGQDKNMKAHNSKVEYIEWFTASPPYNEPYREKFFYVRELTMLSSFIRPENIVEMGTNLGMGTRILATLNPEAVIVSLDNKDTCKYEGDIDYPVGYLIQGYHRVILRKQNSWDYVIPGVIDFCFIDADHTAESVIKDNETAWLNRYERKWAVIWHDYNPDNPDLKEYCQAIEKFLEEKQQIAFRFTDSNTLWSYGGR